MSSRSVRIGEGVARFVDSLWLTSEAAAYPEKKPPRQAIGRQREPGRQRLTNLRSGRSSEPGSVNPVDTCGKVSRETSVKLA